MASNDETSPTPFHMQDEENTSGALSGTEDGPVQTGRVDIGSIQTNSKLSYGSYKALGKGLASSARLTEDGQIVISLDLKKKLPELPPDHAVPLKEFAIDEVSPSQAPPMSIVILIVGSRGDVQPYIVLGDALKKHGHRVRIATHETFRQMVKDAGLEFYPIGGDPTELMSYMVRNPGLLPGTESLLNGDIPRKRKMITEILEGCWKACILPEEESADPFTADAIISNPPAFAHVHCAEALGIPLHLSFTMPWCATTAFPHPLVRIRSSNAEGGLTNYLSYALADLIQWQGIGDIINQFRSKTLGLDALSLLSGSSVVDRLRIPWTYCFSPTLIPKPKDWMNHIDVVGFYFLAAAKSFKPEAELAEFLEAGSPPIYIGFGSVVVEDAAAMTQTIFDAVKLAKVRAIVSAGWGGLGGKDIPQDVFILTSSVPHDWLFTKVSAVCHHGGAGTTAIGLLLGKPTIVVPFFGDQPFWGTMVHKAGAGPEPIPQKELKASTLADAIKYCLTEKAKSAAEVISGQIKAENGPKAGVDSFHGHLPLLNMRCELDPKRVAVWWSQEYCLRLSAFAAQILVDAKRVKFEGLMPHRSKEFDTRKKVQDPITGGLGAIFWTITNYHLGIAQIFYKKDGIISATTAIPRGIAKIVDSVQEGFQNAPAMYGSNVRQVGKITDWKSGFMEGGKGFFYGYYDAITGLVTEPIRGHKEEGMLGILKGSARGILNTTMRPAAGALALVTHPARGIWESIRSNWKEHPELQVEIARRWEGQEAVKNCPNLEAERSAIVKAFDAAKKTTAERKEEYKRQAALFLQEGSGSSLEKAPTLTAEAAGSTSATDDPPPRRIPPPLPSRKGALQAHEGAPSTDNHQEYDQAAFQRDMDEAIRLSLLELEAQKNARSADEENPAKVQEGQKPNRS